MTDSHLVRMCQLAPFPGKRSFKYGWVHDATRQLNQACPAAATSSLSRHRRVLCFGREFFVSISGQDKELDKFELE